MGEKLPSKKIAKDVYFKDFILVASRISIAKAVEERIGLDNYHPSDWDFEVSEIATIASEVCAQACAACHDGDFDSLPIVASFVVNISHHCLYLAQEAVARCLGDENYYTTAKTTLH